MTLQVKQIFSDGAKRRAFAIRMRVFVREQGVPAEIELDDDDQHAIHFLAIISGRVVGTARLVMHGSGAKIGRMAVLKRYRGKGVGAALLKRSITAARRRGAVKIFLHAQVPVIEFYEKMGFHCVGRVFDEAGIAHRKMILMNHRQRRKRHRGRRAERSTSRPL
ncbi:MAG TPA: GNAT family N-acetyltransferase [Candidatus Binatia bacterium]